MPREVIIHSEDGRASARLENGRILLHFSEVGESFIVERDFIDEVYQEFVRRMPAPAPVAEVEEVDEGIDLIIRPPSHLLR